MPLGIHPQGIWPGEKFGVPGTTYFTCRLRSAPSHGLFAEEDAAKKVIKLQKEPANLADAWPNVTWEKKDNVRASTTIGAFIPGRIDPNDDVALKTLLDNVGNGELAIKLTTYLVQLAGPHMLIVKPEELSAWLSAQIDPIVERIKKAIAKQKEVQAGFNGMVGRIGMAAAMLKKVYAETEEGAQAGDKNDLDDGNGEIDPADHHSDDDDYND